MESTEKIIDETLLKRLLFYQTIVPSSPKIFNINVYRFVGIVYTVLSECVIVYGMMGHFMQTKIKLDDITKCQITFVMAYNISHLMRIFTMFWKAEDIWNLSNVTHMNFSTSPKCRELVGILRKYQNLSKKITYFYAYWIVLVLSSWIIFPLVLNAKRPNAKVVQDNLIRYENVVNFQFPVSTVVYNEYYFVFYALEVIIVIWIACVAINFCVFFISYSFTIIAQYEVIAQAFENVGHVQKIAENVDGKSVYR